MSSSKSCSFVALALLAVTSTALGQSGSVRMAQPPAADPLPGLSSLERAAYDAGRAAYQRAFTAEEGLGPIFNGTSCVGCHSNPVGGAGTQTVTQFGFMDPFTGEFDPLAHLGGPVRQANAIELDCRENVPDETIANVEIRRLTLGSMGYGLIEAIPDEAIAANADPDDADGDGVRGFVNWVHALEDSSGELRAGRFGWKSQLPTVMSFSIDASHNELGLTSTVLPFDNAPNAPAGSGACDSVADPEIGDLGTGTFLADIEAFQRYMAPPPQAPRSGMTGEAIFDAIGCVKCHVRSFTTSTSTDVEAALRGIEIQPYSDFLLHHMPDHPDGIPAGAAGPDDLRTPALWGVRTRKKLTHDGSVVAFNFENAIRNVIALHGPTGEGAASAAAFAALSGEDQDHVIRFLRSLGRQDFDIDDDDDVDLDDFALAAACAEADTPVSPDDDCGVADLDGDGIVSSEELSELLRVIGDFEDCNNNGTADAVDIENGASVDTDANGVPDECDDLSCGTTLFRFQGEGGSVADAGELFSRIEVPDVGQIVDVRMTVRNLQHTWAENLGVFLTRQPDVSSERVVATAHPFCGVSWDFIGDYEFRDDAELLRRICTTVANQNGVLVVPPGQYIPIESSNGPPVFAASFAGLASEGVWELQIVDLAPDGKIGSITGWTLDLIVGTDSTDCNANGIADACELDTDGDGVIDDCDLCPNDPLKSEPGFCGCGVPDFDSDGDGTSDCADACPNDPNKTSPGACGCGTMDTDTDDDGTPDCVDGCPNDPGKVAPGDCGCGVADTDADNDGTPDCVDGCPNDPDKTEPGDCGCGVAETDADNDGTPDCADACPNDPDKTSPGECGCGTPDVDSDGDGTADCNDGCPDDPSKIEPGDCGCGLPDSDSDSDGTPDCTDGCPNDPDKTEPGDCGCGKPDLDLNGNGISDCLEEGDDDGSVQWGLSDGGNGHWYGWHQFDEPLTWEEAQTWAISRGGHLVTITSAAEETFVEAFLLTQPLPAGWMGAYQDLDGEDYSEPDGGWRWVTGEAWNFTDWAPGEPNDSSGPDGLPQNYTLLRGVNNLPPLAWDDRDAPFSRAVIEWSADCDGDGVIDHGQILAGDRADDDLNGIPDICEGPTVRVPEDFPTIDAAIAAAEPGSTIQLADGVYTGRIHFAGKPLVLAGNPLDAEAVIIDGTGLTGSTIRIDGGQDLPSGLRHLTIRNGMAGDPIGETAFRAGGGVLVWNSRAVIENCVFRDNNAEFGGGVYYLNGSGAVRNCLFEENRAESSGAGLFLFNSRTEVASSTFEGNIALIEGGAGKIVLGQSFFVNCVIRHNIAKGGAGLSWFANSSSPALPITGCVIENNDAELWGGGLGTLTAPNAGFALVDCRICGNVPQQIFGPANDLGGNDICPDDDCNANGVSDAVDIANGDSADLDLDGIPDDCQDELVFLVPDTFPDIATAVAAAPDGAVIRISAGVHGESIDISGRLLTFRGDLDAPESVILDGSSLMHGIVRARDSFIWIEGLTLRHAARGWDNGGGQSDGIGGGVFAARSGVNITSCVIESNNATNGAGLYLDECTGFVTDCLIRANVSTRDGAGIFLLNGGMEVRDCFIEENRSDNKGGGILANRGAHMIRDTIIRVNEAKGGGGIGWSPAVGGTGLEVQGCQIVDNTASVWGGGIAGAIDLPPVRLASSTICGNQSPDEFTQYFGDIEDLGGNTLCPNLDCNFNGIDDLVEIAAGDVDDLNLDQVPDPCQDTLVFLVPSRFGSIAEAIAAAEDGGVIQLAAGTYFEGIDLGSKNLTLQGDTDDPASVILDGVALNRSIISITGGQVDAAIRGVTLRNGNAGTPIPGDPDSRAGGAIWLLNSTVTIEDCVIDSNRADFGGGVYALNASGVIRATNISGNFATAGGGGFFLFNSEISMEACTVTSNTAASDGGGGKIVLGESSLTDCVIEGNVANGGGGLTWSPSASSQPLSLTACEIVSNGSTTWAGGIAAQAGLPPVILNQCVLCGNVSGDPASNQFFGAVEDGGGSTICLNSDCNQNGIEDAEDIQAGTSEDLDLDGIPDECEGFLVFDVPGDFPTIAGALLVAEDGDVIRLADGVYTERFDPGDRNVSLIGNVGNPSSVTLLPPAGTTGPMLRLTGGQDERTIIRGVTFVNGTGATDVPGFEGIEVGGGALLDDVSAVIEFCNFTQCRADLGGGVFARGGTTHLRNCAITINFTGNRAGGIHLVDSQTSFNEVVICSNAVENVLGEYIDLGGNQICIARDCNGNGVEDLQDIDLGTSQDLNLDRLPDECTTGEFLFNVPAPFATIGDAVAAATDGAIIQLGAGTYAETFDPGDRSITLRGNPFGPQAFEILGTGDGPAVSITGGQGLGCKVIGVTLTGGVGRSDLPGHVGERVGGGVLIDGSSPSFEDCIITANTADRGGGVYTRGGAPGFTRCFITGNEATTRASGVWIESGTPLIWDTVVCQHPLEGLRGSFADLGGNEICIARDCNENGVEDLQDIDDGTSSDANGDGFPDECDVFDCNGNGVADIEEIADNTIAPFGGAVRWASEDGGNDHWYAVILQAKTRNDAAAWAAERGGYLATFSEPGELDFLLSTISPFCCANYVGGVQLSPGLEPLGSWTWETGEPWTSVEWATGEPNDQSALSGGSEQYLQLYTFASEFGRFNDSDGLGERSFIVEWDAAADCDGDGLLDGCEILAGDAMDRNGNRVPDSCEALVVPDQFTTIQAAINAVPDDGIVLVRPGTHAGPIDFGSERDFVLASMEGPDVTAIDGTGSSGSVVTILNGFGPRTRLEGFTIQGGTTGTPTPEGLALGGGLYLRSNSATILNCRFIGNRAPYGGNAYANAFSGTFRNCDFENGFAISEGGNLFIFRGEGEYISCTATGGGTTGDGGGVRVAYGHNVLLDWVISGNQGDRGGGLLFEERDGEPSSLYVVGCSITNNEAFEGAGLWSRPAFAGASVGDTTICDNDPDEVFGPLIDLGGNDICVCAADLNGDGVVNGTDLGLYLVFAGSDCVPGQNCPGDLNGDGDISGADLGLLLGAWGLCE